MCVLVLFFPHLQLWFKIKHWCSYPDLSCSQETKCKGIYLPSEGGEECWEISLPGYPSRSLGTMHLCFQTPYPSPHILRQTLRQGKQ